MVVTGLSEWCVTGAITVWCGAVDGGYRELGKDWFLQWADTHKKENSSKGERGKSTATFELTGWGGRLAVSGKLRISRVTKFVLIFSQSQQTCV